MGTELEEMMEKCYQYGIMIGIGLMKEKMLRAAEEGTPIEVEERAYFVKSDIDYLQVIFDGLEGK